jgi:hypothetical protein
VTVTWYQHAAAYAAMKWPTLAAHSRASVAEALATITPAMTRAAPERPPTSQLRTALYQHAFSPARTPTAGPETTRALAWAQQASLPVTRLADPQVLRRALDALTLRLDGSRAAANTIHPRYSTALWATRSKPACCTPTGRPNQLARSQGRHCGRPQDGGQPGAGLSLAHCRSQDPPTLTAFFGCLHYAALRSEEAIALRRADCAPPDHGWGMLTLTQAAPRTAAAWTGNGTSHEQRGLKHRPAGSVRSHPARPGHYASPSRPLPRHCTRWPEVPRDPRRTAQRKQLRPHLACCS